MEVSPMCAKLCVFVCVYHLSENHSRFQLQIFKKKKNNSFTAHIICLRLSFQSSAFKQQKKQEKNVKSLPAAPLSCEQ